MITLFPAIDILDRRAVRLYQGLRDRVTVYGTPAEMAARWRDGGAEWLHVVDLNGAFDGESNNGSSIREIVARTGLKVQVGGGIRTLDTIRAYLDAGVARVILGTAIFTEQDFLESALAEFGSDRIVCGMDCKDGRIAIKGWVEQVEASPSETGKRWKKLGVKTVVFTDISRDGALTGINVDSCASMSHATGLDIIASGGLKGLDDVRACAEKNLYGAILGKALYEKNFTIEDALRVGRETC